MDEVRIDKWLWAVRIFKTRTVASEACKKGRVMIANVAVKPSRNIRVGDIIEVKKPPITFSFKVLALADKRMGASKVPEFMENITSSDQYELIELSRISGFVRVVRVFVSPFSSVVQPVCSAIRMARRMGCARRAGKKK